MVVGISQIFDVTSSVLWSPLASSLTTTSSPCHPYCYPLHPSLLNFTIAMTTIIPLQWSLLGHKILTMLMSAYRYTLTLSVHSPSSLQASTCMSTLTLSGYNHSSALMLAYLNTLSLSGHSPSFMLMSSYTWTFFDHSPSTMLISACTWTLSDHSPSTMLMSTCTWTLYTDVSLYLNSFWLVSALQ